MSAPFVRARARAFAVALAVVGIARAQATLYFDVNGDGSGSGLVAGATYSWGGSFWTTQQNDSNNGQPAAAWIAGSHAIFATGNDGTVAYTVTVASDLTVGTVTIQEGTPTFSVSPGATWTFSAASSFTLGSVINGAGSLKKSGAGTLTLSGSNGYTGTTLVGGGTLVFATVAALPAASAITLGGGTLQLGAAGAYATSGTLNLSSSSVIDFGAGAGAKTFSFGSSAGIPWTGGATLTIDHYNSAGGDRLRVGASAGGLTPQQLSQITFSGFAPGATIDSAGYLAPVPEPALNAALLGAAGLAFVTWRRRRLPA